MSSSSSRGGAAQWSREFDKGYNAYYWYHHVTGASVWEASLGLAEHRALRREIYGSTVTATDAAASDETDGGDDDDDDDEDDDDNEMLDSTQEQSFHMYLHSEEGKHDMEMEIRELEKKFYRRKEAASERRRLRIEKRKKKYSKHNDKNSVIIGLDDVEVGTEDREAGAVDDEIDSISTDDTYVQEVLSPTFPSYLQWKPISKFILKITGFYIPGDANDFYDDFSFRNFVLVSVVLMKNAILALHTGALASLALVRVVGNGLLSLLRSVWSLIDKGLIHTKGGKR